MSGKRRIGRKSDRVLIIVALAVLLPLGAIVAAEYYLNHRAGCFSGPVNLYVRPGMTASDVIEYLGKETEILRPQALERVFKEKKVAEYIKPGYYRVQPSTSPVRLARMLNNGWESPVNLVISGTIRRPSDIAGKIASQMMAGREEILEALSDDALLSSYGFTSETVLAMFIPDTYSCHWSDSVKEILDRQKKAYDSFWTAANRKKAAALGLSPMEVSVLASIVCSESRYTPELPLIAGVYLNRMKIGMPLQADPTVAFCFDYKPQRILRKHLEVNSPYNTYKYAGLPPGPICTPDITSLNAVLNPDMSEGYIYFCANSDFSGAHLFTNSIAEHNANARAFQRELNRRRKAKASKGV